MNGTARLGMALNLQMEADEASRRDGCSGPWDHTNHVRTGLLRNYDGHGGAMHAPPERSSSLRTVTYQKQPQPSNSLGCRDKPKDALK